MRKYFGETHSMSESKLFHGNDTEEQCSCGHISQLNIENKIKYTAKDRNYSLSLYVN